MKRWTLFALIAVLLGSCGPTPRIIRHRSTLRAGQELGARAGFAVDISSDCIEPGEPLVMTLTIAGSSESSYRFPNTPPVDIVLVSDTQPPTRVAAWSASADYPAVILPLETQETRVYTWTWTSTDAVGPLWVDVQITVQDADGKQWSFHDHMLLSGVGEGYGLLGVQNVLAKCADMQPAK